MVNLFEPISKYSTQLRSPDIVPEIVRKAFKEAQAEKPGGCFIDFPEDIASAEVDPKIKPLKVQAPKPPNAPEEKIQQAADLISNAKFPIIMAGNGVIRGRASKQLLAFTETLNIPVAMTFMAKGAIPFTHDNSLGSVGLGAKDYIACGFDRADVVICVGYDMIEYSPVNWNENQDKKIIHIDTMPAEVDAHYMLECGLIGDIGNSLGKMTAIASKQKEFPATGLRQAIVEELNEHAEDQSFPLKPQKIIWELRQALAGLSIPLNELYQPRKK
ncbi:MAG TPA: hypothetical protein DD827_06900 [Gammaproteobacteria bacterium]|nr:hypothetical protein [Gammaproteobacteria bacterium]